ncbi:unnamed protein product [Bathycoccus prasinos]
MSAITTTATFQPISQKMRLGSARRSSSVSSSFQRGHAAKITASSPMMKKNQQRSASRSLIVRAEKFDTKELVKTVSEKWDDTENKGQVITYVAGATVALWLSSTVVGAINAIPLLPKIMELVGLGYSAWFVYRYVLFKESRKELEQTVDDLLTKISDI